METQKASPWARTATAVTVALVLAGLTSCSTDPAQPSPSASVEVPVEPDFTGQVNLVSESPDLCKLEENSRMRKPGQPNPDFSGELEIMGRYNGNATAFPFAPTTLPVKGTLDVALVYIDWSDSPGNQADFDYYQQQIQLFKDYYWMVSENELEMEIHSSDKWFRLKGTSEELSLTFEQEAQNGKAPRKQVFYDAAVAASDADFDYSGIEIVFFAIPRDRSVFFGGGPHEFNFNYNGYLKTKEGKIYNTASAGDFFLTDEGQPPWVYYAHETGHMIGIPHQANEDQNKPDVEKYVVNPLGGYDIMSNQGGATRTLTSWLRWLAGWLDDSQIICVTPEILTDDYFQLTPINVVRGEKESLIIRLSDTKAVVVESRRLDPALDIDTGNSKDGLIAYVVDATKASAQGNQILLSARDIKNYLEEVGTFPDWRELDAMLFEGDRVEIEGLVIEAFHIGSTQDVVRVTKSSN